jgi:hypothetical protein
MRTPLRVAAMAMACCVLLSMWAIPARAADPSIDRNSSEQQVQAFVTYWMGALQSAGDGNAVLVARAKLEEGYKTSAESKGYTYAERAAGAATAMLSKGFGEDPLGKIKEINLAMAVSQMPQVSIQPALEALVVSKNAAVRYFGWKGYRDAREVVMGQGQSFAQKALAAAAKAAQTEDSGPVLEQIFRMLEVNGPMPNVVKKDVWDLVQKGTLATLEGNWRKWGQQVLTGNEESTDACRGAIKALVAHVDWVDPSDKAQRTRILQELVDMAFCAANAFIQDKQAGQSGDTYSKLLRDGEAALNSLMKTNKEFIKKPLDDPRINANLTWMLLWIVPGGETNGVMAWVDFLKNEGVVQPNFQAPASKPAIAPATAPGVVAPK